MEIKFYPYREDKNQEEHFRFAENLFKNMEDKLLAHKGNDFDAVRTVEHLILNCAHWIEDVTVHTTGKYIEGDLRLETNDEHRKD